MSEILNQHPLLQLYISNQLLLKSILYQTHAPTIRIRPPSLNPFSNSFLRNLTAKLDWLPTKLSRLSFQACVSMFMFIIKKPFAPKVLFFQDLVNAKLQQGTCVYGLHPLYLFYFYYVACPCIAHKFRKDSFHFIFYQSGSVQIHMHICTFEISKHQSK